MSYRNITIAGANGAVGAPILKALLAEPSFNVTILSRATSSATFPAGVPVRKVSDAYTVEELKEAFKDQDAVVVALNTTSVTKDDLAFRIIDGAAAAGVKRLIPSEFGADNLDPRARSLVPVYNLKGNMLEYLIKKAKEEDNVLTWTSVAVGSWLDWALNPVRSGNFLGFDIKNRKATIWDSGRARFSITTSSGCGHAVAQALLHPEITKNRQIFLSNFVASPLDILGEIEKQLGEKFAVEKKESAPAIKELKDKFDAGDFNATYGLLTLSFVADVDVGYDFPKEHEIWNDKLHVPKESLEDIVKEAIEISNASA